MLSINHLSDSIQSIILQSYLQDNQYLNENNKGNVFFVK